MENRSRKGKMKHTISVLVENQFGVLSRVSGLFSARGFNIDSLAVGETEDPTISRMTIVVDGDERTLEQVKKHLNRLIDVIKVQDIAQEDLLEREMVLARIGFNHKNRAEILEAVNAFQGKVVDASQNTLTIEVTGDQAKVRSVFELLKPYGVLEVVRSGRIAFSRKSRLTLKEK